MTGNRSVTGNAINNGVTLAIEEINAKGGVLGKQIKYVIYDNKNDGQETIIQRGNVLFAVAQL